MRPERELHPRMFVLQTKVLLLHHPADDCILSEVKLMTKFLYHESRGFALVLAFGY